MEVLRKNHRVMEEIVRTDKNESRTDTAADLAGTKIASKMNR